MIRIVTGRDGAGTPTGWEDFPQVQADQVSPLLGLRFDRELVELAGLGVDLGVRRWTEAEWRIRRMSAAAEAEVRRLAREGEGAEFEGWLVAHPDYQLATQVGVWAAVNCGGGSMTLREVLELAPRDVLVLDEAPDFLPEEGAPEAGKA